MGIVALIALCLVMLLVFGPQYWVKYVIAKHGRERVDLQGTGGELAEHLIEHYEVSGVGVEMTDQGDHYDPQDRMVRLLANHHKGRSIAAVAIAAHEVGHVLQHAEGHSMLMLRQSLVRFAAITDKIAGVFFLLAPVLGIFVKSPAAFLGVILIGIGFIAIRLVVHAVTLPVEWDASFNKALPILEQGGYLRQEDIPAAREVLRAAALTYVSAALASLLDLARWIRILR